MGELALTALALGLAGLDPTGALIAAAALAAGAHERAVLAFGAVAVLGTAALGTALSLGIGTELAQVDWLALLPDGRVAAVIEAAIGVGLLVWAGVRLTPQAVRPPRPRRVRARTAGLVSTGVVFALSAVLDPTFVAVTVIAGRGPSALAVALAQLLWVLVSQAPLVFVLVAVARGGHRAAVERFTAWWERVQPTMRWIVTSALFLVGAILLVDAAWWFTTGSFLLPGP